jgi:ketosteroid isomerase-like protein
LGAVSALPCRSLHHNTSIVGDEADFEVVRFVWEAFSREDDDAALEGIHPDAVVVPFGATLEGKQYAGHDEIIGWMNKDIRVNWEWFHTDPREFRKVGDRILVYGLWRARGRDSGVELEVPATWVVDVRDGKIAFWQTFTDRDEAHRFIGLRE